MFVIIACTSTVQHLNIPAAGDSPWTILLRKAKWASVMLLFPEFILTHAILERQMTAQSLREIKKASKITVWDKIASCKSRLTFASIQKAWKRLRRCLPFHATNEPRNIPIEMNDLLDSRARGNDDKGSAELNINAESEGDHFSSNGSSPDDVDTERDDHESIDSSQANNVRAEVTDNQREATLNADIERTGHKSVVRNEWTMEHSYFANMGGIRLRRSDPVARPDVSSSTQFSRRFDPEMMTTLSPRPAFDISLNGSQLVAALDLSMISCLPDIPLPNIKDRNKLDFFAKALTLVQIIWLILSLLVRVSRGYGVSQLEIITLAFALCSVFSYGFCWDKPAGVMTAIYAEPNPSFGSANESGVFDVLA